MGLSTAINYQPFGSKLLKESHKLNINWSERSDLIEKLNFLCNNINVNLRENMLAVVVTRVSHP